MKQVYNLKQKQLPRLSMKTWLPLLQCSLSDLDKHLQVLINENPCLDVKSGVEVSESSSDNSHKIYMEYQNHTSNASTDEIEWMSVADQSLYEKLDEQICAPLFPTPISQKIARSIIYYINDEGYFEGDIQEIAQQCQTDTYQVEKVRQRFSYLEPAGVGACDYKESFLFQLNDYDLDDELSILLSALILNFENIDKYMTHKRIHDAKEILQHCSNPPALAYMQDNGQLLPDLFIQFKNNELIIKINNDFYPDLKINQIDKYENFSKQKFKEARELVNLLDLRKATLYNIALVLVERQHTFFMGGELKPLKLQDVADILNFNESTISRAISDKFLECDRGIFSFKDFFSNSIGEVSTSQIKSFMQSFISSEDKDKPFSDKILHEKVEERFKIQMVRRSIAKYRQELNIPSFKDRKFLYKLEML